ncbi:hypothetical protein R3P38DRAFT_3253328 [Favolaschia claudopus]|uniref:Uncharacterized protein n=1 Tax=Favolaschia claudopus TaxID=2862362 RepID=A0AAW0DSU6_9AGAR
MESSISTMRQRLWFWTAKPRVLVGEPMGVNQYVCPPCASSIPSSTRYAERHPTPRSPGPGAAPTVAPSLEISLQSPLLENYANYCSRTTLIASVQAATVVRPFNISRCTPPNRTLCPHQLSPLLVRLPNRRRAPSTFSTRGHVPAPHSWEDTFFQWATGPSHVSFSYDFGQIPSAEERLQHIAEFVKPGGWLLDEDPDDHIPDVRHDDNYGVAHTTALVRELHLIMRETGANPRIGSDLERIVLASNAFSEVNVRRTVIPFAHDTATVETNDLKKIPRFEPDLFRL